MKKTSFFLSKWITFFLVLFSFIPVLSSKVHADPQFLYWPLPSNHSVSCGINCYSGHNGIDIEVNQDNTTPIFASAGGIVTNIVRDQPYGYNRDTSVASGNNISINHENGYTTRYLHMSQSMQVSVGQRVYPGTLLGYGSNSGLTCGNHAAGTGCMGEAGSFYHLHFEVEYTDSPSIQLDPYANNLWVRNGDGSIADVPSNNFDTSPKAGFMVGLGKCLDLSGAVQTNGNPLILYDCKTNEPAQLWMYEPSTKLIRLENNRSKCLDLAGARTANANNIIIYDCVNTINQKWNITPQGEVKTAMDSNKCLDIDGARTANGTKVQIYDCNGSGAQKWVFSARNIRNFNGICLDDAGGQLRSGDTIISYTCNGSNAQKWFYNKNTKEIKSVNGKCIDRDNAGTTNGTRIQLFDCNGSLAQKWFIAASPYGTVIKDVQTGKCIDGDTLTAGTRVHLWTCHNGTNQVWRWE